MIVSTGYWIAPRAVPRVEDHYPITMVAFDAKVLGTHITCLPHTAAVFHVLNDKGRVGSQRLIKYSPDCDSQGPAPSRAHQSSVSRAVSGPMSLQVGRFFKVEVCTSLVSCQYVASLINYAIKERLLERPMVKADVVMLTLARTWSAVQGRHHRARVATLNQASVERGHYNANVN
jgi:hypothetical protein